MRRALTVEAAVRAAAAGGLLPPGARLVVAVSGGRDSVVLLHALLRAAPAMGWTVRAAHYDHGLRPDSADDARWVRDLARRWGVPVTIGRRAGAGAAAGEDEARRRRYRFLLRVARRHGADRVVLAHHQGDQAETVLLRLARGTGTRGAAGMPRRRGRIVRPLLDVPPGAILHYAQRHRLPHREDPTNRDVAFARNRVRHRVIPELAAINPRAVEHLAAWARRLAADHRALEAAARRWLAERAEGTPGGAVRLPAAGLAELSWPLFVRVMARAYARARSLAARRRRRLLRPQSGLDEAWLRRLRSLARAAAATGTAAAGQDPRPSGATGPGGVRVRALRGWVWLEGPPSSDEQLPAPRPLPVPGEVAWRGGVVRAWEAAAEEALRLVEFEGPRVAFGDARGLTLPLVVRPPRPAPPRPAAGAARAPARRA
ncbi:MAG: tRNA lysidine(34) synthetase TilS, partial [Clostridia bacterium]|nr:tRNA lysidine(34) synthetase TilS [Clostridia bacterium]